MINVNMPTEKCFFGGEVFDEVCEDFFTKQIINCVRLDFQGVFLG